MKEIVERAKLGEFLHNDKLTPAENRLFTLFMVGGVLSALACLGRADYNVGMYAILWANFKISNVSLLLLLLSFSAVTCQPLIFYFVGLEFKDALTGSFRSHLLR